MSPVAALAAEPRFVAPPSFAAWREGLARVGVPPVIAVAGSRGKSTVIRLLDAIMAAARLRTATWTNLGVEIRGRHQHGELGPWSRALTYLNGGGIDVAIQELDWAMVHAVGLPRGVYPIVAVTNLCGNSDVCLSLDETARAIRAYADIVAAVHPDGIQVLNGDDFAVAGEETGKDGRAILIAQSKDTPLVRAHLVDGGSAAWVGPNGLSLGNADGDIAFCAPGELQFALDGVAGFHVQNALTAAAIATACGIGRGVIARTLKSFVADPALLPGSFNVLPVSGATAVVDRIAPSWFLKPLLRSVMHVRQRRLIAVVGTLDAVPASDLAEVGRLLGRGCSAMIVHSESNAEERSAVFRQGVALNDVPPVVIHVPTERTAINRAVKLIAPGDVLLVLADQPPAVIRALARVADSKVGGNGALSAR